MKVVILAGGFGTRISDESQYRPKPMVELGGMPILWHIMKLYAAQTLRENIRLIPEGFNLSNVILAVVYTKKKMRILYIPITFQPRQGGVNSINLPKICKIGAKALSDFRKINRSINESLRAK